MGTRNAILTALPNFILQFPKNFRWTSAFFEKLLFSGKFFLSKCFYGHAVTKFDNPAETIPEEVEQLSNNVQKWWNSTFS